MQYFLLIYFNSKSLHVSRMLAAHHQEHQLCVNSNWYSHCLCWLAAGTILPTASQHKAWLYQLLFIQSWSSDDDQQAFSQHVEAYYWNKLIGNSASCCFMLYGYITMHGQQNIKLLSSLKKKTALVQLSVWTFWGKENSYLCRVSDLDRPDRSQSLHLVRSPGSPRSERVMKVTETSDSPSAM